MYDSFSSDYDRFVNWPSRLAFELPFIEAHIDPKTNSPQGRKVLDAACGTGMHVIALAKRGYQADGADLSEKMIVKAQLNATQSQVQCTFKAIGFGGLTEGFTDRTPYDAVLCLGNSLPHLLHPSELAKALADFSGCLRNGGVLVIQNRNFDSVMVRKERWMEPQAHQENDGEWVFLRFYDFATDGLINFNIITLSRSAGSGWQQKISQTQLYPLLQKELLTALEDAGFRDVISYGGMDGQPFDAATSGNLVVRAIKG